MRGMKICVAAKTARIFPIVALTTGGLLLACHGVAKADTDTYLNDMAAAGFTNGSGNQAEIGVGLMICTDLSNGSTEDAEAHELWVGSSLPSLDAAQEMVSIAVQDLCPGT
jgi:hypothetical protein